MYMRTYKVFCEKWQNTSVWLGEVEGKEKVKSIIVITGISDISLAVRRKVKQRGVLGVLNTPETYSFIRTEVVKFLGLKAWSTEVKSNLVIILVGIAVNIFIVFDT